jgi:hypothetical protein
MSGLPAHGPASAPQTWDAPAGFLFEVRLWRRVPGSATGEAGWITVGWCSTGEYAELLAEASMSQPGCLYAEVWGPSARNPDARIALVRYDHGPPDG